MLHRNRRKRARFARRRQAFGCGASLVMVEIEAVSVEVLDGELP
jgi:hypothetical protein